MDLPISNLNGKCWLTIVLNNLAFMNSSPYFDFTKFGRRILVSFIDSSRIKSYCF
uniref:Uncharacterized protein n=1 Tax=Octopus bimaculoides TaxID=37653 RepID=A0A0L8GCT6_OCTBM